MDQDDNYDAVHAWDEGWAFYAGSLEGTDGSGSGQMGHMLAEKRASNFAPTNDVNAALLELFIQGKGLLNDGECAAANLLIPQIVSKMVVPNIQGALRYAYKVAELDYSDKSAAEGWAFARAVLPLINECSAEDAAVIHSNMDFFATEPMADGAQAVFTAFQNNFECLGITCADVGDLNESVSDPAAPACVDPEDDHDGHDHDEDGDEELDGAAAGVKVGVVAAAAAAFAMFM